MRQVWPSASICDGVPLHVNAMYSQSFQRRLRVTLCLFWLVHGEGHVAILILSLHERGGGGGGGG